MKNEILVVGSILKSKLVKKPYKLNFVVTSICNSKCTTCNIWQVYKKNPAGLKKELKIEEIDKIFKKLPKTISWLSLTGGEPFLRADFDKIIISAIKNISGLRLIGLPTNGLAQERIISVIKKVMKIKHPGIMITFSIDGPERIHNKIRGLNGYKTTWQTYEKVRGLTKNDKNFHVGIEITISKKNEKCLAEYLEQLLKEKHKVTLTLAHNSYLYQNVSNGTLKPNKLKYVNDIIKIFIKHKSIFNPQDLIERIFVKNIPAYIKNQNKQVVPCAALNSSIGINQYGDVLPCLMWDCNLGNLRQNYYNINKVLSSEKTKIARRMIKKNKCPICWTPCEAYQSIIFNFLSFKLSPF